MLHRTLAVPLHRAAQTHDVVLVQGPRGAGKTTLFRREFPGHTYVALDEGAERARARRDPEGFLRRFRGPAVVDDLHRAPELIAYLRENGAPRPLLLGSSRRVALPVETLELHGPTRAERERRAPVGLAMLGRFVPASSAGTAYPMWEVGAGYLDRDLPDLIGVRDRDRFESFVEAARSRSGAVLDQMGLARECGVSHTTAVRWLGVLERCFVTVRVSPAEWDFGRRLVRSPKLHFLAGGGFESEVVSEIYRNAAHAGEAVDLRYWRDSNGFEVELVVGEPGGPVAIAEWPTPVDLERVRRWMRLAGVERGAVIGRSGGRGSGGVLRYGLEGL